MSETSLKQAIQGLSHSSLDIIQGVVIAINPIQIKAVKDEKLIIKQDILIVPKHLTDQEFEFSISKGDSGSVDGPTEKGDNLQDLSMTGKIKLNNALKEGDTVHLLEIGKGKRYVILDRV